MKAYLLLIEATFVESFNFSSFLAALFLLRLKALRVVVPEMSKMRLKPERGAIFSFCRGTFPF